MSKGFNYWPSLKNNALQPFISPVAMFGLQKFFELLSPILEQPVQEAIMREIIWTEDEMCIRMKDFEKSSGLPFWDVLVSRVRSSMAGQFIKEFNEGVPANQQMRELQMDVVKATLTNLENQDEFERMNNIVDDMLNLVTTIIRTEGNNEINLKTFLGYLEMLRLSDSKIGSFHKNLIRLNSLKVLVLGGNVIEELWFDCLPPTLRVLELNNNLISQIKIEHKIAPQLVYLGLSSNCFSDESIMEGLEFLDKLCVFDLSDNNFSCFYKVAEIIHNCPYLECICLKGNPLSTVASYKDIIKTTAPELHQLDGVSLAYDVEKDPPKKIGNKELPKKNTAKKERDRKMALSNGFCYTAELRIYVFRVMGIAKPYNKTKKSKGYFQFEVQLPLLDQRHKLQKKSSAMFELLRQCGLVPKASELPTPSEIKDETNLKSHDRKPPKTESRSRHHIQNSEKLKKKEPWDCEYEEFLANDNPVPDACYILSEKMRWAPIMKPNGPIAVMPVNSANLGQLRYTLKSIIIIRLYYHYEDSKDDSNMEKRLIAKISVPAQEPHWKEDYCTYEWNAKQPQIATFCPTAAIIKIPIGSKGKQKSKPSISWNLPTCHLGINLQRIG